MTRWIDLDGGCLLAICFILIPSKNTCFLALLPDTWSMHWQEQLKWLIASCYNSAIATINQSRCVEHWHRITSIQLMVSRSRSRREKKTIPFFCCCNRPDRTLQSLLFGFHFWAKNLQPRLYGSNIHVYWARCTHLIELYDFKYIHPYRLDLIAKTVYQEKSLCNQCHMHVIEQTFDIPLVYFIDTIFPIKWLCAWNCNFDWYFPIYLYR